MRPRPGDSTELLQRILAAVEPPKRKRSFEIMCAGVLALAMTASAWCAYQSKLWGGVQVAHSGRGVNASREAAVDLLTAAQGRAFDSPPLRTTLAVLAVLLFLSTVLALTTMPACWQ